jgi:hypothetical protein
VALPKVRRLLRLYPQAIRERSCGTEGRLPLHEAAAHSSSEEMIECLTDAWSHALGEKSAVDGGALPLHLAAGRALPNAQLLRFLAARHPPALLSADDASGRLPIHRAAAAKTGSVDALQLLVKLCPRSVRAKDMQGRLPLHLVAGRSSANLGRARSLTEAWPWGLRERDVKGQLPLHAAAERGAPVEVVRYLARKYPAALWDPDARGFLPIHCAAAAAANGGDSDATQRGLEVVRFLVEEYRQGLRSTASYRGVSLEHLAAHDEATPEVLQSFSEELPHDLRIPWSTTAAAGGGWLASVKLAFHDVIDTVIFLGLTLTEPLTIHLPCSAPDGPLPLHVAAHRATSLEIVQYLASEDPSALHQRDSNGCLPIHRAARRSTMMDHAPTATTAKEIVMFLAEAHPRGLLEASECGWLPLHLATVAGVTSLDLVQYLVDAAPTALETPSKKGHVPLHVAVSVPVATLEGIESLARKGPRALDAGTAASGFKPVHCAAAGSAAASLDAIYLLATMLPQALCAAPPHRVNESWLVVPRRTGP